MGTVLEEMNELTGAEGGRGIQKVKMVKAVASTLLEHSALVLQKNRKRGSKSKKEKEHGNEQAQYF